MEKCCCFTIESSGVIIATKNAIAIIVAIFKIGLNLLLFGGHNGLLVHLLLLVLAIGVLCICLLSIKGIDSRNHRYVLPMMLWLIVSSLLSLASLVGLTYFPNNYRFIFTSYILTFGLLSLALDVIGIVVMYSLYKKFRVQPSYPPSQHNQQPLQYTEKV